MTRTKWTTLALAAMLTALGGSFATAKSRSHTAVRGKANLNTASERQLRLLPRVGTKAAQAIVAYRAKHKFQSIREILKVRGIGKRTFLRLKPHLTVYGPNTIRKHKRPRKRRARRRSPRARRRHAKR